MRQTAAAAEIVASGENIGLIQRILWPIMSGVMKISHREKLKSENIAK